LAFVQIPLAVFAIVNSRNFIDSRVVQPFLMGENVVPNVEVKIAHGDYRDNSQKRHFLHEEEENPKNTETTKIKIFNT
jgi:hypothetical protein